MDRKRARSGSSRSSMSVATISTKASPSPPLPDERSKPLDPPSSDLRASNSVTKRRRSISSSNGSYASGHDESNDRGLDNYDRSTRRKFSEVSPDGRGRRRSVSRENHSPRPHRRSFHQRSQSRSPPPQGRRKTPSSQMHTGDENTGPASARGSRQELLRDRSTSSDRLKRRRYSDVDERYGSSSRNNGDYARPRPQRAERPRQAPPRERSLSPFSKRLALTQNMNMGR
jgi:hypothetical protein